MALSRVSLGGDRVWVTARDDEYARSPHPLRDLLAMSLADARNALASASAASGSEAIELTDATFLAPVDEQEIWAAGVTYLRSRDGRVEEATDPSIYDRVYAADRPELFLKATASRVVGDGEAVGIRADSTWDVPEPELGLVFNSAGELFGYVVANDMSSRSIEGENPLYLPQAKVYTRSCSLGSRIVPVWETTDAPKQIDLTITRNGVAVFTGTTTTGSIARPLDELGSWLRRALDFPVGVVLLTGTGIVPDAGFTLREGDSVDIEIEGVGVLRNTVTVVGRRP